MFRLNPQGMALYATRTSTMLPPAVIVFRPKDLPVARPLMDAMGLPDVLDDLACYVFAPTHLSRATLDEKLPEGPVEPQLALMLMQALDLLTEVLLASFAHELYEGGAAGQKHFGFHPSATYEAVASRFERDGFQVLHGAALVRSGDDGMGSIDASRARLKQLPKAELDAHEVALVEYVRGGGALPRAGADHAAIALRLGRLITPCFEHWNEIDERILDVCCAVGELAGLFEVYAKRVADRSENAHDTFGVLRRELSRRGIADGRILTALLRAGGDVMSSGVLHVVARHTQLDALVEAVRGSEPSRSEQLRLMTRLLMWTACVGATPTAIHAVIALIESSRGKEIVSDELRAHLAAVHGYNGPKTRSAKTRSKAHVEEAVAPSPSLRSPASSPGPIAVPRTKKADVPPTLAAINETVTFSKPAKVIALGEPNFDGSEEALINAVNARVALAFATDLDRAVTVRITGKGLTGPEADHAVGAHQWYTLKCSGDVMEVRSGAEAHVIPWPKGKCGVEVVAIKVPKDATVADYVLMLRDESPARLPKRTSLLVIPTH